MLNFLKNKNNLIILGSTMFAIVCIGLYFYKKNKDISNSIKQISGGIDDMEDTVNKQNVTISQLENKVSLQNIIIKNMSTPPKPSAPEILISEYKESSIEPSTEVSIKALNDNESVTSEHSVLEVTRGATLDVSNVKEDSIEVDEDTLDKELENEFKDLL